MSSVRSHVRIGVAADVVWRALCDTPVERYHPLATASSRSGDGSILRVVFSAAVEGEARGFTVYGKVVERDDEIRRLRVDTFAAQGPQHDLLRPAAGGDTIYDVLDDGDGCILVMSITDLASNHADQAIVAGYVEGLKGYCENA